MDPITGVSPDSLNVAEQELGCGFLSRRARILSVIIFKLQNKMKKKILLLVIFSKIA